MKFKSFLSNSHGRRPQEMLIHAHSLFGVPLGLLLGQGIPGFGVPIGVAPGTGVPLGIPGLGFPLGWLQVRASGALGPWDLPRLPGTLGPGPLGPPEASGPGVPSGGLWV